MKVSPLELPDFRRLSAVVCAHDLESEMGTPIQVIAARYIDPEALRYVAKGRASSHLRRLVLGHSEATTVMVGAAWFDGFVAGAAFATKGVRSDSSEEDDEEADQEGAR